MTVQPPRTTPAPRSSSLQIKTSEVIYLIGLACLATGISFLWSFAWALVVCGLTLLFTAFWNSKERKQEL